MVTGGLKVVGAKIMGINEKEQKERPDLCKYCLFYNECEMVGKSNKNTTSYSYSKNENGCIMDARNVNQVECGSRKVTDGIGDHFKIEIENDDIEKGTEDRWEPRQPVFISAQTGQGKNYFIETVLIPYVDEMNYRNQTEYKVLILSNRQALKQQIKNHIDGNDDLDGEENKIYSYSNKDVADVMTYQSLLYHESWLKKKQKKKGERYIYIICDEAHFFTSDAMFNPHTGRILSTIVALFQNAIRVYMSATPYDCLEHIINYEERGEKYKKMVFYHFKRDYSYLDVKTYSSIDELYGEIVRTVSQKKEKWLLFIDDKKKCAAVKEGLDETAGEEKKFCAKENVFVIDTDSKKDSVYQNIIKKEKLDKDTFVLISTSVLDNGINLTGITHVVVSDMDRAKCLQMVGRARQDKSDDQKILYIKRFGVGEINEKVNRLKKQKKAYQRYELAYKENAVIDSPEVKSLKKETKFFNKYYNGKDKDWRDAKHWFGRGIGKPTRLYLNEIARSLTDKLLSRYAAILDEMKKENPQADNKLHNHRGKEQIGQKYLEYQLSWFGKEYCADDDITFADKDKVKKEFIAFLKSYADNETQIDKENQGSFRAEFTKLYDAAFGRTVPDKKREYGIKLINQYLETEGINYKVSSKSKYWIVEINDWKTKNLS